MHKTHSILVGALFALGTVAGCSDGEDGKTGLAGAPGSDGVDGITPSGAPLGGGPVLPSSGHLGREIDVTVSLRGALPDGVAPTLDFGPGVTVTEVVAATPALLRAHLAVALDAKPGARDVTLVAGDVSAVVKGAFSVDYPVTVASAEAKVSQGGIIDVRFANHDDVAFAAIRVGSPAFCALEVGAGSATSASATLLTAPLATGAPEFRLENVDASGATTAVFTSAPAAFTVEPATPTELVVGTPLIGKSIAKPKTADLYKVTASEAGILWIEAEKIGSAVYPTIARWGAGGQAKDLQQLQRWPSFLFVEANTDAYLAVMDSNLGGGSVEKFGYNLSATLLPATAVAEVATPHSTLESAQDLGSPADFALISGSLGLDTEVDYYSVIVPEGPVQKLHVSVDAATPMGFDVLDPTGESVWQPSVPGLGATSISDRFSMFQPGIWTLEVRASAAAGGKAGAYKLAVRLEAPPAP